MPSTSTTNDLAAQWMSPSDVSTILFVLGGDIIQKAFTQGSGKAYVPVCFSFGCAAYAFIGLVGIIGDGRLMSPHDYPCKLLNLHSGYLRDSKNFVLGRLLRDLEAIEGRQSCLDDSDDHTLRITVFKAACNDRATTEFSWSRIHVIGILVTFLQITLALIPVLVAHSWNVLLITTAGTVLVQWIGVLPQWRAEKLPNRQKSSQIYALTSGNGSRDVMVIIGYSRCLDLESLATMPSPRGGRPWEKFQWLSRSREDTETELLGSQRKAKRGHVWPFHGLPIGFIITQISFIITCVLWLLLLINVSASTSFPETWCLLGVGALGMFQNAWLAAAELPPELRNIPLRKMDVIKGRKVMDVIMDFHYTYGCGRPLLEEFFPGNLRTEEYSWWEGDVEEYEKLRGMSLSRGFSRCANADKFPRFAHCMSGTEVNTGISGVINHQWHFRLGKDARSEQQVEQDLESGVHFTIGCKNIPDNSYSHGNGERGLPSHGRNNRDSLETV